MVKAKDVLSQDDYANYRNVRAVSMLYVLLGSVLFLGGIAILFDEKPNRQEKIEPFIAIALALAGLAGAVGGIAALRGSRPWSPLVYVMATLYLFGFPLGTILSIVMFRGLSRYLGSVEQIRVAAKAP